MFIKINYLILCFFIVSCSYAPADNHMEFSRVYDKNYTDNELESDDAVIVATEKNKVSACNVLISKLIDKRHSKKSFGTSHRYEKFASSVPEWVEKSLLSIKPHHIYFNETKNQSVKKLMIDVEILKVYVHHKTTSLNANVVIRVKFLENDKVKSKLYRGMDTSINWASGTSDVEEGMNAAISKVLDEMTVDINKRCKNTNYVVSPSL
ncbi:hypothetical protein MNBD_GAMMA22-197 [hydrothermal vent metagenome]|uniref:ABC-type transport auxiliary lipoprotein component domain-containing protein n=1 Tax=hydrothermal vent metagenome TaxID=652676 RepID=A0A3B1APU8_9ZZZZ